jgi:hypothetical protein
MSYEYSFGMGTNDELPADKSDLFPSGNSLPADKSDLFPSGQATAEGFATYAKDLAEREGAAAEDEILPIQELPGDTEGTWIERHQTHITIASTLIGLATFGVWLIVRKKD